MCMILNKQSTWWSYNVYILFLLHPDLQVEPKLSHAKGSVRDILLLKLHIAVLRDRIQTY